MKKLLSLVASAITLGAFADAGNTPIVYSNLDIHTGDEVDLVCDGEVAQTITVGEAGELTGTIQVDTEGLEGKTVSLKMGNLTTEEETVVYAAAPKFNFSGFKTVESPVVCENTILEQNFVVETETTTLPKGWSSAQYNGVNTPHFKLGSNGAVVNYPWKRNALFTSCTIADGLKYEIDAEAYTTDANCGLTLFLSSDTYSVAIGNGYTSKFKHGTYAGDASTVNLNFQKTGIGPMPENITEIGDLTFSDQVSTMTYHISIDGTALTATISNGTASYDFNMTLTEGFAFNKIGALVDGAQYKIGLKSITVKNDQEPPAREPTEITLVNFDFDSYTKDGEAIEIIDGDTIVIAADTPNGTGNHDAWHCTDGEDKLAGHPVIVNKAMNWKWSVSTMSIAKDVSVFYYAGNRVLNGATITGEGTFETTSGTANVEGNTTITSKIRATNAFKLADGATLTVAEKLDDGKVMTDVEKKRVGYNEETKTYSLIQQREMTVRSYDNTTRYYLNAKDEHATSTDKIELTADTVKIDDGTGFTAYYVVADGYEVTGHASRGVSVNAEKTMAWYFFSTVSGDQNFDPQLVITKKASPMPTEIASGSTEQQAAYTEWATTHGITDHTVAGLADAFALNVAPADAQDTVDALCAQIDLSALTGEGGVTAAVAALNEKYPNATFTLVAVSQDEIETTAMLYRLSVSFKPAN